MPQEPDLVDMPGDMASVGQRGDELRREVRVEQELHAGRAIGTSRSLTMAAAYSSAAVTSSRSR